MEIARLLGYGGEHLLERQLPFPRVLDLLDRTRIYIHPKYTQTVIPHIHSTILPPPHSIKTHMDLLAVVAPAVIGDRAVAGGGLAGRSGANEHLQRHLKNERE